MYICHVVLAVVTFSTSYLYKIRLPGHKTADEALV